MRRSAARTASFAAVPVSLLMCLALLVTGCQSSATSETAPSASAASSAPTGIATPSVPPPPPQVSVPSPPAAAAAPTGSPHEQAVALAAGVAPAAADRVGGWLTAYDALGIPVFDSAGDALGTTGDDPIGPPFWRVWYAAGTSRPDSGFLLTDLTKTFNAFSSPTFDSAQAGAKLLADLRAATTDKDPKVRLFGLLVAELAGRGPSPVDILDPIVTADDLVISGDTAELLSWAVTRDFVRAAAQPTAPAGEISRSTRPAVAMNPGNGGFARLAVTPAILRVAGDSAGCTSLANEDATYWLNWAVNKVVAGGVQLPGMGEATKGLVEYVLEARGKTAWQTIEKVKSITNLTAAIANVLSLAMQVSALTVDANMEPTPLERTKETSDGKEATIAFRLTYEPGKLPDGRNMAACVSSYMLNAFGVPLNFPASGTQVAGAELTFEGELGFAGHGEYVLFGDYTQLRQDTDSAGQALLKVLGKAQKATIPETATPAMREFSIVVQAQPEAANGNSIANTFFDSLMFWAAPGGAGAVNAAVDVAKTFHWDLGELVFPLIDWSSGYRVDQAYGAPGGHITGTVCSLDAPFTLDVANPAYQMTGTMRFTPSTGRKGSWLYSGSAMDGSATNEGRGSYTVEGVDEGNPSISLDAGRWQQTSAMGTFDSPGAVAETLALEPAPDGCAKP